MREISINAQNVEGQPMFKVIDKVKVLESQGRNIIHLEIGDPDFDTPGNIVEATKASLEMGETHYVSSWGMSDFIEVIRQATNASRGFMPEENQVLVIPGANIGIFYAVFCLSNPGQEVLVPDPGFPTYLSAIKMCGAVPVPFPLYEKNAFRMRAEDIEPLITNKTRLLIINSPQNPTGAITEPWALKEIYELGSKPNESIGDIQLRIKDIDMRLGYPAYGNRYSKIWNYLKIIKNINELQKQQESLVRI